MPCKAVVFPCTVRAGVTRVLDEVNLEVSPREPSTAEEAEDGEDDAEQRERERQERLERARSRLQEALMVGATLKFNEASTQEVKQARDALVVALAAGRALQLDETELQMA